VMMDVDVEVGGDHLREWFILSRKKNEITEFAKNRF
jgi:hypothetical protein